LYISVAEPDNSPALVLAILPLCFSLQYKVYIYSILCKNSKNFDAALAPTKQMMGISAAPKMQLQTAPFIGRYLRFEHEFGRTNTVSEFLPCMSMFI
jgi:hypothetical protein